MKKPHVSEWVQHAEEREFQNRIKNGASSFDHGIAIIKKRKSRKGTSIISEILYKILLNCNCDKQQRNTVNLAMSVYNHHLARDDLKIYMRTLGCGR